MSRWVPDLGSRRLSANAFLAVLTSILSMITILLVAVLPPAPVTATAQAVTTAIDPSIGVLFRDAEATAHHCTATVLTAGHGLVLTAAHCVKGTGIGMRFIPGYDGAAAERAPFRTWTVRKVWAPPGWLAGRLPADDFAVLEVSDQRVGGMSRSIDEITGGHDISTVGTTANATGPSIGRVTVVAYNAGAGDMPFTCTTGHPNDPVPASFRCGGYSGGTSGAPWLQDAGVNGGSVLVGIIGGLHQGGCTDSVSYSPRLDGDMLDLLSRAKQDLPGDDVPAAGDDGC